MDGTSFNFQNTLIFGIEAKGEKKYVFIIFLDSSYGTQEVLHNYNMRKKTVKHGEFQNTLKNLVKELCSNV